jgi:carbamoyl-phosphate synthase large subunit
MESDRELVLAFEWGQVQLRGATLSKMSRSAPEEAFIFQQWWPGQEYGLDVVNDLDGRYAATLARQKLVMRVGNTDRAITVAEPRLERLGKNIGERLGHIGCLDCDVLATENGLMVLDLNPRFGGGYPFSHLAGANLPAALIAWANGEELDSSWLKSKPGVTSAKYDGVAVVGSFIDFSGMASEEKEVAHEPRV